MELTNSNYYKNNDYMSYSEFKNFDECENKAMATIRGDYVRPTTNAFLMGGYVDAFFSGEMQEFIKSHYGEIYMKNGKPKADFVKCDAIIDTIRNDDYFMSYYKGQSQVILTGRIANVAFKGKLDMLFDDKIVDMKLMKDTSDVWVDGIGKVPFWKAYGYDIQASIYQELVYQKTGKRLPYYLAVATKQDTPQKHIIRFSQDTIDSAMNHVMEKAPRYDAVKGGILKPTECGHCDWYYMNHKMSEADIEEA